MRIKSLKLHNFRTFRDLELTDLPDFIALVSPNGGGKSTILEAIAGIKDLVIPYNNEQYSLRGELRGSNYPVWPSHLRPPLRFGQKEASISLEVEAGNEELEYLKREKITDPVGRVTCKIENGRFITDLQSNETIRKLFRFHRPTEGVGFVDYIKPVRYFDRQGITDPTQADNDDRLKEEFSAFQRQWQDQTKFGSLKTFIVQCHLEDDQNRRRGKQKSDILTPFIDAFNKFLAPKQFLGFAKDQNTGQGIIAVQTPIGEHDIDLLSDGEKEIMYVLGHLFRFRPLQNVVLWDTPEAHLNSALESKLYSVLNRVAPLNQYWVATHSIELINSVPLSNVFILHHGPDGNTLERPATSDRRHRMEIYRELGAPVATQLLAKRIAFVEGEEDERILHYFFAAPDPAVRFVDCRGVRRLKGVIDILIDASGDDDFCAVCDRDDLTDQEIVTFEAKKPEHIFVWRRREIENYLLDEEAIFNVIDYWKSLRRKNVEALKSRGEVAQALRQAADRSKKEVVAKKISHRLGGAIEPIRLNPANLADSLEKAIGRRAEFCRYLDAATQQKLIDEVHSEVEESWNQQWKNECLGKETIKWFLQVNFEGINDAMVDSFIEEISQDLAKSERIPSDILKATRMIWKSNNDGKVVVAETPGTK